MTTGFVSFIRKEALHILRDKRTMLIVLIMPVIQLILFGFAISTEVRNIDVAVVAPHRTEAIRQAVDRMSANEYFTFKGYVDQSEIDDMLRKGKAGVAVVFADDFDRRMAAAATGGPDAGNAIQLVIDASNPNDAASFYAYLQGVLLSGDDTGVASVSLAAMPETRLLYNPRMESAYNFVPGIMGLIFIMICAMMTSVSIVREKEMGTMEVLLVSPVRPVWIVFAKMIPYFVLSCFNLVTILFLARYLLQVPLSGSITGLIGISLLYLALALALGLLISTIAERQVTAMLVSGMVLMLPLIMLSGMIFPVENMPGVLQGISWIIPARWYIAAVRKLMIEGLPFVAVIKEFAILVLMTVVIMVVALKSFKDKLE